MNGAEAADLVRSYWQRWARRDKAGALALISDDIHYELFVGQEVLPFGGDADGKAAASDRLQSILDVFDTVRFEGEVVRVQGCFVHGRVDYVFRHKVTGDEIDGVLRQVIEVRDGRIVSWREYTDVEKVRAFMRLVAHSANRP